MYRLSCVVKLAIFSGEFYIIEKSRNIIIYIDVKREVPVNDLSFFPFALPLNKVSSLFCLIFEVTVYRYRLVGGIL